ncbi:MAG TPA: hypothetical protein VH418_01615 [Solirubrobacteraceae bacterium]|jgi:hypothetical protein
MDRFRLVLLASCSVGALALSAPAYAAVGNGYSDGQDAAVLSAAPDNFRLNPDTLEPGCLLATRAMTDRHIDIGDDTRSVHLKVRSGQDFSVDQVLVPGRHTGYAVYNTFDTGTIDNDPDVDPGQTATNLEAPDGDNVAAGDVIICVSDHEDSGQNEPYVSDGIAGANEVAAKNRPILQPAIATLGQSAVNGLTTYKMGLGYSVESWYSEYTIADSPAFTMDWTDPMAFLANPDGSDTPSHVSIPPRIDGPQFDATGDGPGVLRVNDIDTAGEDFANPHFERANYGQTSVFNVAGDPKSFCLGGPCAGLIAFGTQGDLPVSWTLKASLAPVSYARSVQFTDDDFRAWDKAWQDYYCGNGPKPSMPLTPGTNSPTPRACPIIVNPPVAAPPTVTVSPTPVVVHAAPVSQPVAQSSACTGKGRVKITLRRGARKGSYARFNGRKFKAHKVGGRMVVRVSLAGVAGTKGSIAVIHVHTKLKHHSVNSTKLYNLC